MTHHLPILLLAAGSSSRMRGADKLMQSVDGRPLVRRQAEMARAVTHGPIIVALPDPTHPRWLALDGLDVIRVAVPDAHEGINASMRRTVSELPAESPAAMVLLADLPDLFAQDLSHLLDQVDLNSNTRIWRAATKDGAPGHPVVFHRDLFDVLKSLTGDSGGRDAFAAAKDRIRIIPLSGQGPRTDLDTPEAWDAWRIQNPDRS